MKRHALYMRDWRAKHPEDAIRASISNRKAFVKLRYEVLSHYSGGKPKCKKCGFEDIRALCIDHINNGGCRHRKSIRKILFKWLKKQGLPPGYQVLCANCNTIKQDGVYEEVRKRKLEMYDRKR